jgi:hypothetical protein
MSESPASRAIPEGSILLHIGMHKTGTTAVQEVMRAAHNDLLGQGVFYPPTRIGAHHWFARSLLQRALGWGEKAPPKEAWGNLLEIVLGSDAPRIVLSSEHFAGATEEECQRLIDDLGADRLHIVVGVRNFAPIAVSMWQQGLKRGRTSTLDEWLDRNFKRTEEQPTSKFWDRHDPSVPIERWVKLLGPERVNVVVIDEKDRELLPSTFEELLALPAGIMTSVKVTNTNRGMTAVETELLRRVNDELRPELTWPEYADLVRYGAIRHLIEHRKPPKSEPKLTAPGWVQDQGVEEGKRVADAISTSGARVFGNLANLTTHPSQAESDNPLDQQTDAMVDLAVDALVGAVRRSVAASRETNAYVAEQRRLEHHPRVKDQTAGQLAKELGRRIKRRLTR